MVQEAVWHLDPHTAAKHRILRSYLDAWLPIMGKWNNRIIVLDGFAGPGRYAKREEGSPLIALRALLEHPHMTPLRAGLEVRFHFVEERPDRLGVLEKEVARFGKTHPYPPGVHVNVAGGRFDEYLGSILDELRKGGKNIAPTFAFIDPFGFSGVPMELISRLAKNPKCEVLISFMFDSVVRWAGRQPKIAAHLTELFGTDKWRAIAARPDPGKRRDSLIALYRSQLVAAGFPYVCDFEMLDKGNRTEYFLYFGTTNLTGLSAMKYAMWKADPSGGRAFSDYIELDRQLTLVGATAPQESLSKLLLSGLSGQEIAIEDVERFVLTETIYSERKHLRRATLLPLEKEGKIRVRRPKGSRAIPGQYPSGTVIRFS